MFACLKPGGGCLLTVRDYDREPRGTNIVKPYDARIETANVFSRCRCGIFAGEVYDLTLYMIEEDLGSGAVTAQAMRSRYYAIGTDRLLALMQRAASSACNDWMRCFTSQCWSARALPDWRVGLRIGRLSSAFKKTECR